ncbi:MAG TPA: glycerate kinase [Bryobacteraceae bacterium]|nr:glycerate kinase [Bryobacteraceae bacterium]
MMPSSLRADAIRIFKAALKAAAPAEAVRRHVHLDGDSLIAGRHRYRLNAFRKIHVIGAGKASAQMAIAIERLLGKRIAEGCVNVPYGTSAHLRRVELNESGHPVPNANGERGAARIAEIAKQAGADDLVLCLISGGASALMPLAAPPVTLEEKQIATKLLLNCGATIHEINCIRKHISLLKGGGLARLAYPATVLTLLLSDVIGDDLDVIGSGPTVPDRTTVDEARAVFEKYRIWDKAPAGIRDRLSSSASETPKPGDRTFAKVQNLIVGSNRLAVDAAAQEAKSLGYKTLVLASGIQGEAREVARVFAAIAKEIRTAERPLKPPACIIAGGETTVTLRGDGTGGRNQELVLAAAIDISGLNDVVLLSGGTDGADGPTDAAGAIADGTTIARAQSKGLDAAAMLANNDSYHFFDPLGGLIKTGPTGTNVADIQLILAGR